MLITVSLTQARSLLNIIDAKKKKKKKEEGKLIEKILIEVIRPLVSSGYNTESKNKKQEI
jgi:hypothetical protein